MKSIRPFEWCSHFLVNLDGIEHVGHGMILMGLKPAIKCNCSTGWIRSTRHLLQLLPLHFLKGRLGFALTKPYPTWFRSVFFCFNNITPGIAFH